jgi:hypothetical protein
VSARNFELAVQMEALQSEKVQDTDLARRYLEFEPVSVGPAKFRGSKSHQRCVEVHSSKDKE